MDLAIVRVCNAQCTTCNKPEYVTSLNRISMHDSHLILVCYLSYLATNLERWKAFCFLFCKQNHYYPFEFIGHFMPQTLSSISLDYTVGPIEDTADKIKQPPPPPKTHLAFLK